MIQFIVSRVSVIDAGIRDPKDFYQLETFQRDLASPVSTRNLYDLASLVIFDGLIIKGATPAHPEVRPFEINQEVITVVTELSRQQQTAALDSLMAGRKARTGVIRQTGSFGARVRELERVFRVSGRRRDGIKASFSVMSLWGNTSQDSIAWCLTLQDCGNPKNYRLFREETQELALTRAFEEAANGNTFLSEVEMLQEILLAGGLENS